MSNAFVLNLRLSFAVALVTVWAVSSLADVPYVGDSLLPLLIAPTLLFTRAQWLQPKPLRDDIKMLLLIGVVLLAAYPLFRYVSDAQVRWISHNPIFVIAVWSSAVFLLVKRATAMSLAAGETGSRGQEDAGRSVRHVEPNRN